MEIPVLKERHQKFWHLGIIQGVSMGLPGIIFDGVDFFSILLGNFALWMIALPITLIAYKTKSNGVENVNEFMGKIPCLCAGVVVSAVFLLWYMLQNKIAMIALSKYWDWPGTDDLLFSCSVALCIFGITFFGIRAIRHLSMISLPILFGIGAYLLIELPGELAATPPPIFSIPATLGGASIIIAFNLPNTTTLPTFFRHAESLPHVILGLTCTFILVSLGQIFGLYLRVTSPENFFFIAPATPLIPYLQTVFVFVSLVCANVMNVYFASAGIETVATFFRTRKLGRFLRAFSSEQPWKKFSLNYSCGLIALIGLVTNMIPETLNFISKYERISDNILSTLGIILFYSFFMRIILQHRHRVLEHITEWLSWLIASIAIVVLYLIFHLEYLTLTLSGIGIGTVIFGMIIFFEVNYWSCKTVTK